MDRELQLYERWLQKTRHKPDEYAELAAIRGDEAEIADRFYRDLAFGTAGLRGVLGLGTNRMNRYTVGRATRGLAQYLLKAAGAAPRVAIAFDSRNGSEEFSRHTACVLAASGVKAYRFERLAPTPALSFAVRELGCDAGVVITASHNPARYNGYKVYGPDGCQIGPEVADAVLAEIAGIDVFDGVRCVDYDEGIAAGMIETIGGELLGRYLDAVQAQVLEPRICAQADLSLVYTPLNGAGLECVRAILGRLGVRNVRVVPEQEHPDGNFPTCPTPNPETREALQLGLALCEKTGADLLLATDPDCDRVSAAVPHGGEYRILSGNEIGVLLLDYICRTRRRLATMPEKPVAVRSVVSTPLADEIARAYGVEPLCVPTGFKFIGEVIAGLERAGAADRFLFGFEESCGYLSGAYVRDKDAVGASALLVEMAGACKLQGITPVDRLREIYEQFGFYRSVVDNYAFEGRQGMLEMGELMRLLRESPPVSIGGGAVVALIDYQDPARTEAGRGLPAGFPKLNMLEMRTETGCVVMVRPSGTEPKIKVYFTLTGRDEAAVDEAERRCRAELAQLIRK